MAGGAAGPGLLAGVAEHSDYRRRSLDRLRRTARYVAATTFGTADEAEEAARRARRVHPRARRRRRHRPALQRRRPEIQLWVHCVEWHSFLAAYRAFGPGLSREDADRYLAEGAQIAALLGVPPATVPRTVDEQRAYFARVRPQLCVTAAARDAVAVGAVRPLVAAMGRRPLRDAQAAVLGTGRAA